MSPESESPTDQGLPAVLRRRRMAEVIASRGFVKVVDLGETFGISGVTVRSDLDALERARLILRVHGGAVPRQVPPEREASFEESLESSSAAKERIGAAAAAMVASGQSVLLDVGTTTLAVARALVARSDLHDVTIVTNGLTIALELERAIPRFTVVVTGGTLRPLQHSLVDPLARPVLEQMHADIAFLGCNGVDVERGVTNINLPEAEIKRLMLGASARPVVVADSSKLDRVHLGAVGPLADVATLITDDGAAAARIDAFRAAGVDVVVAGSRPA
ncbi:DeoR/GlpR family DNA-binding transcription regulator [Microbacteriaceae bacterium 4G12]